MSFDNTEPYAADVTELTDGIDRTDVTEARDETRQLSCVLTREELLEVGDRMAQAQQDLAEVQQRRKEVVSQLKADEELCNARLNKAGSMISTRREVRGVACRVIINRTRGTRTVYRMDTGETVEHGPLSDLGV